MKEEKVDILAIGVHPDDIELCCGGTLLSHIDQGMRVGLCDLTQGELGSRGSAEIRLQEAESARDIMGASFRENLGMLDGFFEATKENRLKIINVIRKYRPDIVLANAINDRHPDHGRAAKLIADSCYYSGLVKIETGLPAWRPMAVYNYIQDYNLVPDFVVDISPYVKKKEALILSFKTQFYNPKSNEKMETPISSKAFLSFIEAKARVYGRHAGFEFGEGFTVARPPGIKSLFDIK